MLASYALSFGNALLTFTRISIRFCDFVLAVNCLQALSLQSGFRDSLFGVAFSHFPVDE